MQEPRRVAAPPPTTTPTVITRDAESADGVRLPHSDHHPAAAKASAPPLCLLDTQRRFVGAPLAKLLTDNVDFVVVGVVGAQGAGKSALLSDICGAAKPYPDALVPSRRCAGYVALERMLELFSTRPGPGEH